MRYDLILLDLETQQDFFLPNGSCYTITAEDARSKRALPLKGNELSVSLPSQGWMLVWLRAERQP